ncbi:putative IQ and AAA domain-containing protein 1 [Apostichopus japonicus]|uniref:Putative IQ and AAA domain-containing protein 1 n=1 Tax=Stichopus japonicus TaxID=307972 RepID=A0A2G8KBX6_STIJA|nr:putative IQ and AAA domain-containing protein 1 [Apostichopus japonicus]
MSTEEAVRNIQVHERARQGRLRAKFMREIRLQEERERLAANRGAPTLDNELAAVRIQKIWKGYSVRKRIKKEREDEMIFIRMTEPPLPNNSKNTPQNRADNSIDETCDAGRSRERIPKALVTIKDKLRCGRTDMKETMQDQIRQWFLECRDATGKFPDFPPEDEGGSALIFKEKDPAEMEAELQGKGEEKGKKKGKKSGKKKDKKKDKRTKKGKKGKRKRREMTRRKNQASKCNRLISLELCKSHQLNILVVRFRPPIIKVHSRNPFLHCTSVMSICLQLHKVAQENSHKLHLLVVPFLLYSAVWKERNEENNFNQKSDSELIKEQKRIEVETEIRSQVDELMRQELKNLKLKGKGKKGKKGKKSGKKSGKKKKKKKSGKKSGKKGKKGKKEKDLTPDRTMDSLYEELVREGILVRCPKFTLCDYLGDYSYLGTTLRQADIEPMPSLSDVRQLVALYGVLPLGSPAVHEKSPHIKSLLLAGPRGTGKRSLVHAICSETGANLFDLTAGNIAGKYPGKSGLQMLLHLVMKVGRNLQPSVFYMGDCEKTWMKKVPKTDKSDPKRLKKDLPKVLKLFKPEDRILLVGTSRCPFESEMKGLAGVFQKMILIPRPDYASRNLLWRSLIPKSKGILSEHLDISSLAKVTDGYTQKHIVTACQQVLTDRRVTQLAKRPLVASEFIPPLARIDPFTRRKKKHSKPGMPRHLSVRRGPKLLRGVTKMTAREERKERKEGRKAKRERRRSRLLLEK